MLKEDKEPQLVDTTDLTDVEWAAINEIKQAYAKRGQRGFERALDALYKRDHFCWLRVVLAYYPRAVREAMRDKMAASGVSAEELQDIFGTMERPPTRH